MRILNGLKQRIIDRLSYAVQQRLQPPPSPRVATVKPNAVIFPEATIENISGLESHIVIGSDSYIRGRLLVYPNGGSINIGQWCYVGIRTEIWSMASITIGDRVLISHDVNIIDNSGHSKNAAERHTHFRQIVSTGHAKTWAEIPGVTAKPIVIEDDVWISCGAIILQGVRIGARSVIAAGSVVTKDVPPDSIYRCSIMPILKSLVLEASVDLNNA